MKSVLIASLIITAGFVAVTAGDTTADLNPVLSLPESPESSIAITWPERVEAVELRHDGRSLFTKNTERAGPFSRVIIEDLSPSTTYEYRAVGAAESSWHSFTTAPPAGSSETETYSFAVAGDLQPFNEETRRTTTLGMTKVGSLEPEFILQLGDIAEYGFSRRSWSQALFVLSSAADEIPVVPTAGNHDYYGVRRAPFFKSAFPAPFAEGTKTRRDTWYSQTIGPVYIAVLDTESRGESLERQTSWLDADLQAARDAGITWRFVAMHRPVIATATSPANPVWARELLPIFARHGVAAVFWGHDHMYEHYEFTYGANGFVFDEQHEPAIRATHLFTAGTIGARVDALYSGFFTHKPALNTLEMFNLETDTAESVELYQRAWDPNKAYYLQPGIRYQDPDKYRDAASYYSYPFENPDDALARRYSADPAINYSETAEFFGYTYGETSIHYLWIDVTDTKCTITAHYVDGPDGEHGTVLTTPDGVPERWVLSTAGE